MIYLALWNVAVFLTYGVDKFLARKHLRRISEKTLITLSFLLGSMGAILGMVVFNHKTSKIKFRVLVPLSLIFNIICIIALKRAGY